MRVNPRFSVFRQESSRCGGRTDDGFRATPSTSHDGSTVFEYKADRTHVTSSLGVAAGFNHASTVHVEGFPNPSLDLLTIAVTPALDPTITPPGKLLHKSQILHWRCFESCGPPTGRYLDAESRRIASHNPEGSARRPNSKGHHPYR